MGAGGGCPHLFLAGQSSSMPTFLGAHQATAGPEGGPGAASTCGAGQTHLEPTSPFCLSPPPDPLRVWVLPACTLGLPPHPWSGLCVLFGSWKEADKILQKGGLGDRQRERREMGKEEGKRFGFYKVKEFIS